MKYLGKNPPKNNAGDTSAKFVPVVSLEIAEHFRRCMLEAADILGKGGKSCGGDDKTHCWLCELAKKLRKSAGEAIK